MDKRTQRILGILVIIALVIILFPLLSEKSEQPTAEAANLSAPQFPEQTQAQQATASEDAITIIPTQQQSNPQQSTPAAEETASNNNVDTQQNITNEEPSEESSTPNNASTNADTSSNKNTTNKVSPAISMDMDTRPTPISDINIKYPDLNIDRSQNQAENVEITKEIPKAIAVTTSKKPVVEPPKPQHKTEKDLAKLGSKAWAVQMGSFNNKSNALRLVDKLRASGYKAFTRDVTTSSGKVQTRVYIGPEFQQASALRLSTKVEQETTMHGIIVSYQPLSL